MHKSYSKLLMIIVLFMAGMIGWGIMTMPDQRTTGERIGDAVDAMPEGIDKAARQLEPRSPGQKLGDAVKDAGESIKRSTASPE